MVHQSWCPGGTMCLCEPCLPEPEREKKSPPMYDEWWWDLGGEG